MEVNEVEKIYSTSLLSNGCENEKLVQNILEKSQEVVKLREVNAEAVSKYINDLDDWGKPMLEALEYIHKEIDVFHKDDSTVEAIKNKCITVKECFRNFRDDLSLIDKRFRNKKIRITSIGAARSGKSEFTRLYTGLGKEIIKTQKGDIDCTGAVCNLHHDKNMTEGRFKAVITFHKEKEIIEILNALLIAVRNDKSKDERWNCQGKLPETFTSITEVKRLVDDRNFATLLREELHGVDVATNNGLMHFFEKSDYLSVLLPDNADETFSENRKEVTTAIELEEYNYMQAENPKYVAVKQIDLSANLSNDGIFENFIVADTKGASSEAGPQANVEIIHSIEESDAVFSIHYVAQGVGYDFYNVLLRQYALKHNSFRNKHFVIVNSQDGLNDDSQDGLGEGSRDKHVDNLLKINTTKCIYIGQLVNSKKPEEPELFSRAVILDMLGRIAKYVRDFDQERVNECNARIEQLTVLLQELDSELKSLPLLLDYDKVKYIQGRILRFTQAITAHIAEKEKSIPEAMDYETARKSGKLVTPYEIITGKSHQDVDLMDDTDKAVDVFCQEIKKVVETPKDDLNIGRYLMDFVEEFLLRVGNRKHDTSIQKKIDIKKETDDLFTEIWAITKLSVKYTTINNLECRLDPNRYIQGLIALYTQEWSENNDFTPHLFNYYPVLKSYFNSSNTSEESEDLNKLSDIVDFDSLKLALQGAVSNMELRQYLETKYQDRGKALSNLYLEVREYFQKKLQRDACLQFYVANESILTLDDADYDFKRRKCEADLEIKKKIDAINLSKSELDNFLKPLVLPNKKE